MNFNQRVYMTAQKIVEFGLEERTFSVPLKVVGELAEIARQQQKTVVRLCSDVAAEELAAIDPTVEPFSSEQRASLPPSLWEDGPVHDGIVRIVLPEAYYAIVAKRAWEQA